MHGWTQSLSFGDFKSFIRGHFSRSLSSPSTDLDFYVYSGTALLLVRSRSHSNKIKEKKRFLWGRGDFTAAKGRKQFMAGSLWARTWHWEAGQIRTDSPGVRWVSGHARGCSRGGGWSAWKGQANPCGLEACILEAEVVGDTHMNERQF